MTRRVVTVRREPIVTRDDGACVCEEVDWGRGASCEFFTRYRAQERTAATRAIRRACFSHSTTSCCVANCLTPVADLCTVIGNWQSQAPCGAAANGGGGGGAEHRDTSSLEGSFRRFVLVVSTGLSGSRDDIRFSLGDDAALDATLHSCWLLRTSLLLFRFCDFFGQIFVGRRRCRGIYFLSRTILLFANSYIVLLPYRPPARGFVSCTTASSSVEYDVHY